MKQAKRKGIKGALGVLFALVMILSTVLSPLMGVFGAAGATALAADDEHIGCSKDLESNGDGTYTLSLSVTGSSEQSSTHEVKKTNVIIVMDTSNSMSTNTYLYTPGTDTNANYGRNAAGTYIQLWYRNGAWRTSNSNNGTIYTGTRYVRSQDTRINAEQAALGTLVENLLGNNTATDPDIIEISLVRYNLTATVPLGYTHGEGSTNSHDYNTIMAAINDNSQSAGTNWDDGLRAAVAEAVALRQAQPNEDVFVIFLTDGEPTASHGDSGYSTGEANYWRHWGNALSQADDMTTSPYHLYTIFTYGENQTYVNYLRNLTRAAYGTDTYTQATFGNAGTATSADGYFFNAADTSALQEAFETIFKELSGID